MSACNINLNKLKPAAGTIRAISAEGGRRAGCRSCVTGNLPLPGESA